LVEVVENLYWLVIFWSKEIECGALMGCSGLPGLAERFSFSFSELFTFFSEETVLALADEAW
jgi:hypothetical protein